MANSNMTRYIQAHLDVVDWAVKMKETELKSLSLGEASAIISSRFDNEKTEHSLKIEAVKQAHQALNAAWTNAGLSHGSAAGIPPVAELLLTRHIFEENKEWEEAWGKRRDEEIGVAKDHVLGQMTNFVTKLQKMNNKRRSLLAQYNEADHETAEQVSCALNDTDSTRQSVRDHVRAAEHCARLNQIENFAHVRSGGACILSNAMLEGNIEADEALIKLGLLAESKVDFQKSYGILIGGTLGSKTLIEIVNMHFTIYHGHAGTPGVYGIEAEFEQEFKPVWIFVHKVLGNCNGDRVATARAIDGCFKLDMRITAMRRIAEQFARQIQVRKCAKA